MRAPSSNGFSLILGEPGSGKSTLLENWFFRLAQELPVPTLGMLVPVRSATRGSRRNMEDSEGSRVGRCLVGIGPRKQGATAGDAFPDLRTEKRPELSSPVAARWPGRNSVRLRQRISLPDACHTSRRQSHFDTQRGPCFDSRDRRQVQEDGARAPPLDAPRPGKLPAMHLEAGKLLKKIQRNIQVRLLAGNPLLLGLMAEVASGLQGEKIELPGSRSEFYRQAVDALWHRKLKDEPSVLDLWEERDEFLTRAAETMGLTVLKKRFSSCSLELRYGLRKSGLLRVDERSGEYEFVHLTFHEYYLARFLAKESLKSVLQKHWNNPRYEETLGLLISILFREERFIDIEEGIQWLVHLTPKVLWNLRCSPLRVALHILGRSGIPIEGPGLAKLSALLAELVIDGSAWRRKALSLDRFTPSMLLAKLAQDENKGVRARVAWNASALLEDL